MRGWHGGSGTKGSVNNTHIGFEICKDDLTDAVYFGKVYQEAVELCAYLCKQFSLNPTADGVIIGHFEGYKRGIAPDHGHPNNWSPKHGTSMDSFRAAVAAEIPKAGAAATPAPSTPAPTKKLYRVQCGAFSKKANANALAVKIKAKGHDTYIVQIGGLYKVQCGAFEVKANADKLAATLKSQGFENYITTEATTA